MGTEFERRMKKYEYVTRNYLTCRTPVIIRLDGRAFRSFTRGFEKPFDELLTKSMQETMRYLCENIEGCALGYTQSDEITLILCDYKNLTTQAWFDNNISKICSISASMATLMFNRYFGRNVDCWTSENEVKFLSGSDELEQRVRAYSMALAKGAIFDSRAYNIPKEEVNNCLLWRQQDAERNSVLATAQAYFSHQDIQGENTDILKDRLLTEKSVDWNALPTSLKRGSCCIKLQQQCERRDGTTFERPKWVIDTEIPNFNIEPRYVNNRIIFDNKEDT